MKVRTGPLVALLISVVAVIASPGGVQAAPADSTAVCCAWNDKLADGELTYKISGASGDTLAALADAVEDWEDATGILLTPVQGRAKPDIAIKFKAGGGTVQGQALRKFDFNGFITSVSINVSGKAFGIDIGAVHQIAMHEVGHALGAGHADGDGVLMSPTVSGGVDAITTCDRRAVLAAQAWWADGNPATGPAAPSVASVVC